MSFDPVARRAHVNNWTPEHQRAFVAALALTGSARMAARAIGRHAFGAEQLKTARGGRSFADACDAALELYREREMFRIRHSLSGLAEQAEERDQLAQSHLRALPPPFPSPPMGYSQGEGAFDDSDSEDGDHALASIRRKLIACRRLYLAEISTDPARRAAWELLAGPVDWDLADGAYPQPNEPPVLNMRQPDMVLTVASGMTDAVFGTAEEAAGVNQRIANMVE